MVLFNLPNIIYMMWGRGVATLPPSSGMLIHKVMVIKRGRLVSGEASNIFPEMSQNVSKEIEDEANSYFQRIYNHPPHPTLSIDEVLEMLKKFQDSPNKRERVSYAF
jgi:hypothetical protein